jgi:putative flippase GtrA
MTRVLQAVQHGWSHLPLLLQQVLRFGTVSATALIVDVTAYATLVQMIHPAALAAFIAYAIGGLWHYLFSTVVVFRQEMPDLKPMAHLARFLRYFGSTLVGLTVTTGTVALLVDGLGHHPYAGKLVAIPLSFFTVFTMVRLTVFARGRVALSATSVTSRM